MVTAEPPAVTERVVELDDFACAGQVLSAPKIKSERADTTLALRSEYHHEFVPGKEISGVWQSAERETNVILSTPRDDRFDHR